MTEAKIKVVRRDCYYFRDLEKKRPPRCIKGHETLFKTPEGKPVIMPNCSWCNLWREDEKEVSQK